MVIYEVRDVDGWINEETIRTRPFAFHDMKANAEVDRKRTRTAKTITWKIKDRADMCRLLNTLGEQLGS